MHLVIHALFAIQKIETKWPFEYQSIMDCKKKMETLIIQFASKKKKIWTFREIFNYLLTNPQVESSLSPNIIIGKRSRLEKMSRALIVSFLWAAMMCIHKTHSNESVCVCFFFSFSFLYQEMKRWSMNQNQQLTDPVSFFFFYNINIIYARSPNQIASDYSIESVSKIL